MSSLKAAKELFLLYFATALILCSGYDNPLQISIRHPKAGRSRKIPGKANTAGGGIKFGYNGSVYSVYHSDCSGGVAFPKPLKLDFICMDGYFLQREFKCNSTDETIISGEDYVCIDYPEEQKPTVQAFISLTEGEMQAEHTIIFYDNEGLHNFRMYPLAYVMHKVYHPNTSVEELAGPHMIIINSHNTPGMNIGKLCYDGSHGTAGSAFMLNDIQQDFTGESYGFFTKPCDPRSHKINFLEDGKEFKKTVGLPAKKDRFKNEIVGKPEVPYVYIKDGVDVDSDSDSSENSEEGGMAKTTSSAITDGGDTGGEGGSATLDPGTVFINIPPWDTYDYDDTTLDENNIPDGNENADLKSTTIIDESAGGKEEGVSVSTEKIRNGTDIVETTPETDDGGEGDGEDGGGTNDGDQPEGPIKLVNPNNLKAGVVLGSNVNYLDPFFEEEIVLATYFLDEIQNPEKNLIEVPKDTMWYNILKALVEVVKKIIPDAMIADAYFDEILKIFSYMFRNIDDVKGLLREQDKSLIIDNLKQCGENAKDIRVVTEDCPALFKHIPKIRGHNHVHGWNADGEEEESDPSILSLVHSPPVENRFNSKSVDILVESMWNVVDMIYAKCLSNFESNLGQHTRMLLYLTEILFLSDRVQARWYRRPEVLPVYESLLPFGDLESLMYNFDKLRAAVHYGAVLEEWTPKPRNFIVLNTKREAEFEKKKLTNFGKNPQNSGRDSFMKFKKSRKRIQLFGQRQSDQTREEWGSRRKRRAIGSGTAGVGSKKLQKIWDGLGVCMNWQKGVDHGQQNPIRYIERELGENTLYPPLCPTKEIKNKDSPKNETKVTKHEKTQTQLSLE